MVTSFLTYPPGITDQCEWDFSKIQADDLLLQRIIFESLEMRWQCFRSTEKTREQLEAAGFSNIRFIYDEGKLFPTVVAYK